MTQSHKELALLDTSVLIHLARNDSTGQVIEHQYALTERRERPLLSTIVEGETLALARYLGWGAKKAKVLQDLLHQLVRVDAGEPEIVNAYVELYNIARGSGHRMGQDSGQNDLWIGATALATRAEIYTCDKDFNWLHPQYLTVHYIPESNGSASAP